MLLKTISCSSKHWFSYSAWNFINLAITRKHTIDWLVQINNHEYKFINLKLKNLVQEAIQWNSRPLLQKNWALRYCFFRNGIYGNMVDSGYFPDLTHNDFFLLQVITNKSLAYVCFEVVPIENILQLSDVTEL